MPRFTKEKTKTIKVHAYLLRNEEQNRKDEKGECIKHIEKRIKSKKRKRYIMNLMHERDLKKMR